MMNKSISHPSLFRSLADQLNQKHPLYQLGHKIGWQCFEGVFLQF